MRRAKSARSTNPATNSPDRKLSRFMLPERARIPIMPAVNIVVLPCALWRIVCDLSLSRSHANPCRAPCHVHRCACPLYMHSGCQAFPVHYQAERALPSSPGRSYSLSRDKPLTLASDSRHTASSSWPVRQKAATRPLRQHSAAPVRFPSQNVKTLTTATKA